MASTDLRTHPQDLAKTPVRIHRALPLLLDLKYWSFGRREVPLNDSLINAVTYFVRRTDDIELMTVFAMRIGQVDLLEQMWEDGEGQMDVIMRHLLKAWSPDVDATEENLLRFLEEFDEFEDCVKCLNSYITKQRKAKRTKSDSNLLDLGDYTGSVQRKISHTQLSTSTIISQEDIEYIIKSTKKKVKDKSILKDLARLLKVHHVKEKIAKASKKHGLWSSQSSRVEKVLETILYEWMWTIKANEGTAEELVDALVQLDDPDDVFFNAKKYLKKKEQMKFSRTSSAMQLNQVPYQPRKNTFFRPNNKNTIAE